MLAWHLGVTIDPKELHPWPFPRDCAVVKGVVEDFNSGKTIADRAVDALMTSPPEDRGPTVLRSINDFVYCNRRVVNGQTLGFADPTFVQCVADFRLDAEQWWAALGAAWGFGGSSQAAAAAAAGGDPVAMYRERRVWFSCDPTTLPWDAKPEYIEYLRRHRRLAAEAEVRVAEGQLSSPIDRREALERWRKTKM